MSEHVIYPYDAPQRLAKNLWQVRGSFALPGAPRNMTIYRLGDGRLLLYSVIAMQDEGMHALEALGEPALMVMPHDRHQIEARVLPGTSYHEVVLELPIEDGVALCTTELLGNTASLRGWFRLLMTFFGPPGGGFGVSRGVRWREVVDKKQTRAWLRELSERADIKMVLLGHGPPVTEKVPAAHAHAATQV